MATQNGQQGRQIGPTRQAFAAIVTARGASLLGLGIVLLGSLSQAGREWADFSCACVQLAITALPSVALLASHALQTHAGHRIVEGLLEASGCLGMIMLNLITR
jgi:hypothetical protein